MALNFPADPTSGDTYTEANTTWQYDGVAWNVAPGTGTNFPNSFGTAIVNGVSLDATASGDSLRINSGTNVTITSDTDTNTLTINSTGISAGGDAIVETSFFVAADDSTQKLFTSGETLKFVGGTGINTSSDDEGNITIDAVANSNTFSELTDVNLANLSIDKVYEPAIAMLRVDNNGTSSYTFPSHYAGANPTIYAISGTTIAFDLTLIPGHPFEIQDNTLTAIDSNLVHVAADGTVSTNADAQGKTSGVLYWRIPENANSTFVYQCQSHASMFGSITVKDISNL